MKLTGVVFAEIILFDPLLTMSQPVSLVPSLFSQPLVNAGQITAHHPHPHQPQQQRQQQQQQEAEHERLRQQAPASNKPTPRNRDGDAADTDELPPLPRGWGELRTGDGRSYYVYYPTGAVQWQRPAPEPKTVTDDVDGSQPEQQSRSDNDTQELGGDGSGGGEGGEEGPLGGEVSYCR